MRGGQQTSSEFSRGFLAGWLTMGAMLILGRTVLWAQSTDVAAAVETWATTPLLAPIELVAVVPVVLFVVVVWAMQKLMTLFGGVRA